MIFQFSIGHFFLSIKFKVIKAKLDRDKPNIKSNCDTIEFERKGIVLTSEAIPINTIIKEINIA